MLITDIPKAVAVGTPSDLNRWLANEANQVINEVQNLLDDTGQTKSASDLFQTSKAVARYVFGNTIVEDNGTSTHNASVDIYIVQRDGGDSKKLPAVLLRGMSSVKIINANQSNNVSLQLGTTTAKEWKKFDMAGNLTEIPVGEFRADDIVFFTYDSDDDVYIVKKALSNDEVQNIVGKFNILNFLDFTASAPVAGGTIGDRYINTTGGTISAGKIDAAGTTVVANKIYELYDDGSPYHWREIDEQDGDIVFNDNDKSIYLYDGTSWTTGTFNDVTVNEIFNLQGTVNVISGGAITFANSWTELQGQGAAADTLIDINGGSPGDFLIISNTEAYDLDITHNASKINLRDGVNIRMINGDRLGLLCLVANTWIELFRSLGDSLRTGSGYYYLPNNRLVQFGSYVGGAHAPTITFPIAYDSVDSVVANDFNASHLEAITTLTTANFVGDQVDTNGTPAITAFYWQAVGTKAQ